MSLSRLAGLPSAHCMRCNRAVDRLGMYEDPTKSRSTIVAWCHGERCEVVLTDEELEAAQKVSLATWFVFGDAKALTPGEIE